MAMQRELILFLCILILGRAAVILNDCQLIEALNGQLLYDNRLKYMSDYFPTDYRLYVKYEEVLRCQNITTLIDKGITVKELRYLWGIINERILFTIQRVLPSRHPSYVYVSDLLMIFTELLPEKQEVENDIIREILDRLGASEDNSIKVKAVPPKALLDNCFRVLYALYKDECRLCNPSFIWAF
ncbi:interleukin-34 isoform X2 [Mixophyes fleayi]|uniref:interleukin-34 isoform X2 n=1 Tax=Mixophyes fleayi TaxID=3061075 RepID=UPI003F4E3E2F